ncbi:MAG: hypothetical protein CMJ19_23195 [Phycisphaeraceae bacterium]|nr:hypothetical protein [Phycisphaeraceae bacterium]
MQKMFPFHLRATLKPTISLPLACRSVGHYKVFPGWHNPGMRKDFCELFWGIKGEGQLLVDNQPVTLKPDHILVLYSGDLHHVTARDYWEYRWMTLDGQIPDQILQAFGFDNQTMYTGKCPEELFTRLSSEIHDISPHGQRIASTTAYEILSIAISTESDSQTQNKKSPSHQQMKQALTLIKKQYHNPDLNVTEIARQINIHRTNLSKLFKNKMKMTPIEYLSLYRVSRAIQLIQGTDLSFAQIANKTGFACPNYFTNVIRKRTGESPSTLRQQARATQTTDL